MKTLQQTLLHYSPKNCRRLSDDAVPTEHLPTTGSKNKKQILVEGKEKNHIAFIEQ